ncbi:hypothetical protein Daus18300_001486 [Diaporthe australafricana]|uniref:F-box domain-containing protein n=1 Tax=Diaporthe australafricana TaxID=127596 RepID=A0ABR3XWY7_9PEZI
MKRTRSGKRVEVPSNEALGKRQQVEVTKPSLAPSIHWGQLPDIVQQAVLSELAEDYNRHSAEDRKRRAAYAAVCQQWQELFEKLNFSKLVLLPSALKEFGNIVKRRSQNMNGGDEGRQRQKTAAKDSPYLSRVPRIQHIWLRIELLAYDCTKCKSPEEPREAIRNNVIFTKALWTLLNILDFGAQRSFPE